VDIRAPAIAVTAGRERVEKRHGAFELPGRLTQPPARLQVPGQPEPARRSH
jgi:hypothetical protein